MHGGDIYRNKVKYDFSVNVNPLGMPKEVTESLAEAITMADKYPDLHCEELSCELSKVLDIPEQLLVFGNGASEIIMAICHYCEPESAMLVAPGFSGYGNALSGAASQCKLFYHYLKEEEDFELKDDILDSIEKTKPELLFLTNPNNPNGRLIDRELLDRILSKCHELGTTVIIDECFLPLTGRAKELTMIGRLKKESSVIVLRAFTKTFAMAGVRLGYAVCSNETLARGIDQHLPEWNISVFAQKAGVACLYALDYVETSVEYIAKERQKLTVALRNAGFKAFSSDANYILFRSEDIDLFDKLLCKGILIRDCHDYVGLSKGYYRVAIRSTDENDLLMRNFMC